MPSCIRRALRQRVPAALATALAVAAVPAGVAGAKVFPPIGHVDPLPAQMPGVPNLTARYDNCDHPGQITVKNAGDGPAGSSKLRVEYGSGHKSYSTPELAPGQVFTVDISSLDGVTDAVADATNEVAESKESDNRAVCLIIVH